VRFSATAYNFNSLRKLIFVANYWSPPQTWKSTPCSVADYRPVKFLLNKFHFKIYKLSEILFWVLLYSHLICCSKLIRGKCNRCSAWMSSHAVWRKGCYSCVSIKLVQFTIRKVQKNVALKLVVACWIINIQFVV